MPIPGNFLSSVTEMVDPNTSGWTPLLNCTLLLGTGGRNGDGVLTVKSVAAGETRARTVASYPVQVGTVYQTFADASAPTVSERIGIRWLDALNTELSITWSLTTSTVASALHRIGVAGAAPMGAVRAQVVLAGMTPAAAGVLNYFENVYLGLPIRITGNLLDFNTETIEVDTSGWAVESNCTLTRTAPATAWTVAFYHAGGHMLSLTAAAAGNMSATIGSPVPCTPGTEYVFFGHIAPPVTGTKTWFELRFLDAAGTLIKAVRTILDAPGTGVYRQIGSDTAPAGTATAVLAAGMTGATSGQVMRIDNCVVAALQQTLDGQTIRIMADGNVVPYADSEFEQGVAGWTVASGPATIARSSPWGARATGNQYALSVASNTAGTTVLTSGRFALGDGAAGDSWSISFDVTLATGAWTLAETFTWYNAAGTVINSQLSAVDPLPSSGWWTFSSDGTRPAGAVSASIQLTLAATAASSSLFVDRVALRPAKPMMESEVFPDTASVRLTLRTLNPGDLISLWRTAADGSRTFVRGPSGLLDSAPLVSDTLIVEDYEAPLGEELSWSVETRNPTTGAITLTGTWNTATIPVADRTYGWLKDPGNPQRNQRVLLEEPAPDFQEPIDQATYVVQRRTNKVIRSGTRQGLEGDLTIATQSDDERLNLKWLLSSGTTLFFQAAPGFGIEDMYVSVGPIALARPPSDATDPWRTWTLPLIAQDMPATVGVAGSAGRTWQDILSEFATWQDVLDTFATWEDLFLNRRKAA